MLYDSCIKCSQFIEITKCVCYAKQDAKQQKPYAIIYILNNNLTDTAGTQTIFFFDGSIVDHLLISSAYIIKDIIINISTPKITLPLSPTVSYHAILSQENK